MRFTTGKTGTRIALIVGALAVIGGALLVWQPWTKEQYSIADPEFYDGIVRVAFSKHYTYANNECRDDPEVTLTEIDQKEFLARLAGARLKTEDWQSS
ncbi:MAG: hypothetical protein HUU29_07505 [Planctomycetaceae bacterium]|nr:hypothetical protein [Planctomycetaceae bacterium]